jgi:hypothetical protein
MQPDHDRRCKVRARENSFLTRLGWVVVGTAYLWCGLCATAVRAQIASAAPSKVDSQNQRDANREANCGILYLGFVGALETSNNQRSGAVQIRDTLRGPAYPDVCARSFPPTAGRRDSTGCSSIFLHARGA